MNLPTQKSYEIPDESTNPEKYHCRIADIEDGLEKLRLLISFFMPDDMYDIMISIDAGMPVRKAAMTYHMSRYNIRKKYKAAKEIQEAVQHLLGRLHKCGYTNGSDK